MLVYIEDLENFMCIARDERWSRGAHNMCSELSGCDLMPGLSGHWIISHPATPQQHVLGQYPTFTVPKLNIVII